MELVEMLKTNSVARNAVVKALTEVGFNHLARAVAKMTCSYRKGDLYSQNNDQKHLIIVTKNSDTQLIGVTIRAGSCGQQVGEQKTWDRSNFSNISGFLISLKPYDL